ncbi:methyltransferase domain-containing protein [Candidatus Parcubacteria bacterium]|nr:methyltransferase domain-containing protein [Candidatus Parcubacteria bacterium]
MAFALPEQILPELSVNEGDHVADLGAGSGAYALAAAKLAGGSGRVYAVDVQKDMLTKLKNEAASRGIHNLEIIWGDAEAVNGTKLAPHAVDRAIISNVLFQAESKEGLVKEARRILKPNGLALVVDWSGSYGGIGPKEDHVVPPALARRLFSTNGFAEVKEVAAGDYHYGILFRKL